MKSTKTLILACRHASVRIAAAICLSLMVSCVDQGQDMSLPDDTPEQAEPQGSGNIAVQLQGSSAPTRGSMTSVITEEEARLFLVIVFKGSDIVSQQIQLGSLGTVSFPAGYGYKVSVENITAEDAITLNDGWGAKRYTGGSKSFGIIAGETTRVAVPCTTANAAVAINIDESLSNCRVTITSADGRTLTTTENRTAYFNVSAEGQTTVSITIEKDGQIVSESNEIELGAAQVKDINIKPKDDNESTIGLDITYDDSYDQITVGVNLPLD